MSATDSKAGRYVVYVTPGAGAELSKGRRKVARDVWNAYYHHQDCFEPGSKIGASVRGVLSIVDGMVDPINLVYEPIHKFAACGGFLRSHLDHEAVKEELGSLVKGSEIGERDRERGERLVG